MKAFLKNKMIMSGVFMIVFYQIIMIGIFMSGYSAVPKNLPDLTVAIVNEDPQSGAKFVEQLKEQLPFHVVTDASLDQAKQQLEDREIPFIMHIPADFTGKLSAQGEQAKLDFFINESNPATVTSSMHSVANQVSSSIIAQIQSQSFEGLLQGMKMPADQSKQTVESIMGKVETNIVSTNPQPAGTHNQMAPMFLTMASYVGAMIYSMMSIGTLNQLKGRMGKWRAFGALQGVNALLSLIAPLVGLAVYFSVHGYGAEAFLQMWMVHALEMFVAITFTSLFCLLLGQAGMIVNLPILLTQTIANGAVVPREMMPAYFEWFSYISPMYYTVHLDYNVLFGGGRTAEYLLGLGLVGLGALIVNSVIHQFKAVRKPLDNAETAGQPVFM
ncbi:MULTISPECIES: YhgE/Pip domain-containing protein [Paenibacillus]|uniref:YhgE/Pip domain-containing protein n=1 Tax=Paenibacillus TaxID=44249 RepID=UPI00039037FB|nr:MULTISPECIES: ABC transporter permease [Paenibacillus]KKC45902.1 YhgE/Pip N-terminal domain protein [Paenibacillus sp. D9]CDN44834.1 YhgE/Pip N-terminal domain protein [Paenibacillus sp. P22]